MMYGVLVVNVKCSSDAALITFFLPPCFCHHVLLILIVAEGGSIAIRCQHTADHHCL